MVVPFLTKLYLVDLHVRLLESTHFFLGWQWLPVHPVGNLADKELLWHRQTWRRRRCLSFVGSFGFELTSGHRWQTKFWLDKQGFTIVGILVGCYSLPRLTVLKTKIAYNTYSDIETSKSYYIQANTRQTLKMKQSATYKQYRREFVAFYSTKQIVNFTDKSYVGFFHQSPAWFFLNQSGTTFDLNWPIRYNFLYKLTNQKWAISVKTDNFPAYHLHIAAAMCTDVIQFFQQFPVLCFTCDT